MTSTFSDQPLPQISIFQSNRLSSNEESVSTEKSTPVLQDESEFGSSSCGEESPLKRRSPLRKQRCRYSEDFYKSIEDFLDLEGLQICSPEDRFSKRGTFWSLRVSAVKATLTLKSEKPSDSLSECNSPGLISPNIQTSSLFLRRSLSKDCMNNNNKTPAKNNRVIPKSPFFNSVKKQRDIIEADDEFSPSKISAKEESLDQERSSPNRKSPVKSVGKMIEFSPVRLLRPL